MGAITFTKGNPGVNPLAGGQPTPVIDNKRVVRGTLTFSDSYATGGDTLALGTTGLTEITGIYVDATFTTAAAASGLSIGLAGTKAVPLVLAMDANNTQVSNATDLSTRTAIPVLLLGA